MLVKKKLKSSSQPILKKKIEKKVLSHFRPQIRSRHPSHSPLRHELPRFNFRSVVRFGSQTELVDDTTHGGRRIECNTIESVQNSSSKIKMKRIFSANKIKTAEWWLITSNGFVNGVDDKATEASKLPFPLIIKHKHSSGGEGIYYIKDEKELAAWRSGKTVSEYIVEKFYTYAREYRLHITEDGCFYACRKMIKNETKESDRWHRHDTNSVWIVEENPSFNKPANWSVIVAECVKALKALKLDIGAFDIKVQSSKENSKPDFFILESNSAPGLANVGLAKYVAEIPKILLRKNKSRY